MPTLVDATPSELRRLRRELDAVRARIDGIDQALARLQNGSSKRRSARPLPFYSRVQVSGATGSAKALNGKSGIVVGRAKDEVGNWLYAVLIDDQTWQIPGRVLTPTGETVPRSSVYSGKRVRVAVDSTGRGRVAASQPRR
jgi:hypothetical protein